MWRVYYKEPKTIDEWRLQRELNHDWQRFMEWVEEVDWDKWEQDAMKKYEEEKYWGDVDMDSIDLILTRRENRYNNRLRKHILKSIEQWTELQRIWKRRKEWDRYKRMYEHAKVTISRSRKNITFKNLEEYEPSNVKHKFEKMGRLLINEMLRRLYLVKIKLRI